MNKTYNKDIKLINGECLQELDKLIEQGIKVDSIICDPPYGTIKGLSAENTGFKNKNSDWDIRIDNQELFSRLNKILNTNGRIILFSQEPYSNELIHYVTKESKSSEIDFNYRMIWDKKHFANCLLAKKAPVSFFEDIIVFTKKYDKEKNNIKELRNYSEKLFNKININRKEIYQLCGSISIMHFISYNSLQFGLCNEKNYNLLIQEYNIDKFDFFLNYEELKILNYKGIKKTPTFNLEKGKKYKSNILEYKKDYNGFHPTQKPVKLMEDLVYTYTNENEVVLDFTMGSGSTGVACKNLNRKFIGIELDEEYFKICEDRILK